MVSHTNTPEVWKPIKDFPNYEVSNHGRIRSLERTIYLDNGTERTIGGRILAQGTTSRGYKNVCIRNEHGPLTRNVHRLVMETHAPNPENLPIINHVDEDQTNNHINNLEWCTYSHNATHNGVNIRRSKTVYQYTPELKLVKVWRTANEASEALDGVSSQGISNSTRGKVQLHAGHIWSYTNIHEQALIDLFKVVDDLREITNNLNNAA